jgi:hypothetical protein
VGKRKKNKNKQSKKNNSTDIIKPKRSPKLVFLLVGIIVLCVVCSLLAYFDYLPLSDPQLEPFEKRYYATFIEGMNVETFPEGGQKSVSISGVSSSFLTLDGEIILDTTSRSARNPIDVTIKLITSSGGLMGGEVEFEELPKKLHFEFPNAKIYNSNEDPVIELELKNDINPYYIGHSKLFYDEKGEYDFYLQESKKYQDYFNYTKTETDANIEVMYIPTNDPEDLGLRIMEISETPNEKIKIESYGQTITKEGYKMQIISIFIAIFIGTAVPLIIILRKFYSTKSIPS